MMKIFAYKKLFPLFVIQFFTWLGLFALWIYATPVFTNYFFSNIQPESKKIESAATWVGICFALYSVLGASLTFVLNRILKKKSKLAVHACALFFGGIGLMSISIIHTKYLLLLSFVFVGIAWSSISTTPYKLVGELSPEGKEEEYYSVFNFSTVIPQVVAAFLLAFLTKTLFHGNIQETLFLGGIFMLLGSLSSLLYYIYTQSKLKKTN